VGEVPFRIGPIEGSFYYVLDGLLRGVFGEDRGVALLEYFASHLRPLGRVYRATREPLVRLECDYFLDRKQEESWRYEKVVMVGGGAMPVTAIHWANRYGGPIVVLEKDAKTARLTKRTLEKLNIGAPVVLCQDGNDYEDYEGSLVLTSLHVTEKAAMARRALNRGAVGVCVRLGEDEECGLGNLDNETIKRFSTLRVIAIRNRR